MSLLCLDFGNTRLKWGLRSGRAWAAQGALVLDSPATLDGLGTTAKRIVACNVAGVTATQAAERLAARLGAPLAWLQASAERCGVVNGYAQPGQLGADRWAALIGARALHRGACLVAMCGTATTVDVLDAEGRFCGGVILPGVDMMRSALAVGTAGLPAAAGRFVPLPDNTFDAIASGGMHATLGAIERMYRRLDGMRDPCCLISGGAAALVAPHLDLPLRRVDNLVLEGLATVAEWPEG